MDILSVIATVLISFIMILVRAFALSAVVFLVTKWSWLYTMIVPKGHRDDRRAQIRSDLHDHITDAREAGHRSAEIAAKVLFRMMWGITDDVMWSVSYIPTRLERLSKKLARSLERGSEVLAAVKPPTKLLAAIATLGMMNWVLSMSEDSSNWKFWLLLNGVSLAVLVVTLSQPRAWARAVVRYSLALAILLMSCFLVTMVLQHQLYLIPAFYLMLPAILPVALSILVTTRAVRVHAFRGQRWPIFASWVIVFASSLAISGLLGWLSELVLIWASIGLLALLLVILCVIFATGVIITWYIGLKAGGLSMQMIAAGIRRLM